MLHDRAIVGVESRRPVPTPASLGLLWKDVKRDTNSNCVIELIGRLGHRSFKFEYANNSTAELNSSIAKSWVLGLSLCIENFSLLSGAIEGYRPSPQRANSNSDRSTDASFSRNLSGFLHGRKR